MGTAEEILVVAVEGPVLLVLQSCSWGILMANCCWFSMGVECTNLLGIMRNLDLQICTREVVCVRVSEMWWLEGGIRSYRDTCMYHKEEFSAIYIYIRYIYEKGVFYYIYVFSYNINCLWSLSPLLLLLMQKALCMCLPNLGVLFPFSIFSLSVFLFWWGKVFTSAAGWGPALKLLTVISDVESGKKEGRETLFPKGFCLCWPLPITAIVTSANLWILWTNRIWAFCCRRQRLESQPGCFRERSDLHQFLDVTDGTSSVLISCHDVQVLYSVQPSVGGYQNQQLLCEWQWPPFLGWAEYGGEVRTGTSVLHN